MKVIYKQMLEFDDINDDEDIVDRTPDMIFLPFDPSAPETFVVIVDDIIKYFEDNEEYEKCAELINSKKKLDDFR